MTLLFRDLFLGPVFHHSSPRVRTCSHFWEFVLWHEVAATPVCQKHKWIANH